VHQDPCAQGSWCIDFLRCHCQRRTSQELERLAAYGPAPSAVCYSHSVEVRAAGVEEGNSGLSSARLGDQSLTWRERRMQHRVGTVPGGGRQRVDPEKNTRLNHAELQQHELETGAKGFRTEAAMKRHRSANTFDSCLQTAQR